MNRHRELTDVLERIQIQLNQAGLATEWYVIEDYNGYSSVTGNSSDTVYCLEACLGTHPDNPEHTTYAIVQVFWHDHLNLSMTTVVTLDRAGEPVATSLYSREIDKRYSMLFLPVIYRAFNTLDPKNGLQSQIVQRYTNNRVLLQDFIPAAWYTFRLLTAARFTGQLATIAGDFDDILTRIIAILISPFIKGQSIHIVKATGETSMISVPTRKRNDPKALPYRMQSSTALDQCFRIAKQYIQQPHS